MSGLPKMMCIGIILVILIFAIVTISAGNKELKKKNNVKLKFKGPDKYKSELKKKYNFKENLKADENDVFNRNYWSKSSGYKHSKGIKVTSKDKEVKKEFIKPKITKMYKKVNKYKIVGSEPIKKVQVNKFKVKKSQEFLKEKSEQKINFAKHKGGNTLLDEQDVEEIDYEKQLKTDDHQNSPVKNEDEHNQKINKCKIMKVVLEEEQEETDNYDGYDSEIKEVIEDDSQSSSCPLVASDERMEHSFNEECHSQGEEYISLYEEPTLQKSTFKPVMDDQNKHGPKKLTLFVIEDEVDGEIRKRVVPEEDGITMCEVAELLKENYYGGLI